MSTLDLKLPGPSSGENELWLLVCQTCTLNDHQILYAKGEKSGIALNVIEGSVSSLKIESHQFRRSCRFRRNVAFSRQKSTNHESVPVLVLDAVREALHQSADYVT